jgi:hypothetical protein
MALSEKRCDCRSGSDIDLSILKNIKNENLVEHIERVGLVFYQHSTERE